MIPLNTAAGERRAWEGLLDLSPEEVCRRAPAIFLASPPRYVVRSFGMDFSVWPQQRRISGPAAGTRLLLAELRDLFVPSLLVYLLTAKEAALTGRLVRPTDLRGGHLFSAGTHVLPLDEVADRYGADGEAFLARGRALAATPAPHGDVALCLLPLPRLPVHVVLWLADEEFPARADLLLDSSCEVQAPADLLWAVTTLTVLALLRRP